LEEAAQRLETAVRRAPTDWNAHLLLGRAYQRLGRDADADRELRLGEAEWRRRQR
jgi:Flp pilus assembly protein TadD